MVCIEAVEQIKRFEEFIQLNAYPELLKNVSAGIHSIVIDGGELAKFDPELVDNLLDDPEEVIKAAEMAVLELDLPSKPKDFKVRFKNLPSTQKILVRDIRSKHVGGFLSVDGIVRQKSDVRPQVTSARFECPSCGNVISVLQLDTKFKDPSRCGCGRKGKFKLLSKEMVDAQRIVLEESPDTLEGGDQPKRMDIFLKHDLVSPLTDRKTNPGTKILVNGIVKEVPITLKEGGQSIRFDLLIEANYVQPIDEDVLEIGITPEEEAKIKELASHPQVYEKLSFALAPSIYGHDRTKEAIIAQLVGGCQKKRADGTRTRGDLHILLIGDPGAGKSMLLKRSQVVAPKSRYVTGKGATGAGLCVAPQSMILTNPGGIQAIQALVEPRLTNPEQVTEEGVLRQQDINDIKIQSLAANLKMQAQHPESVWKLPAPTGMYVLVLSSGKKTEVTANTKLLSIANGKLIWKKASEVSEGDPIATPRHLFGGEVTRTLIIDLIKSDPTVHGVKPFIKEVATALQSRYGTIRNAARKIGVSEDNLYYNWVNEKARGNISLGDLKKISEEVGMPWKEKITEVSLYNGKVHKLPTLLTPELLYVAGLIAGDGDIQPSGETKSIRLSNSEPALHQQYQEVLTTQFGLKYDVQQGNEKRPAATRTHSKLLAEIMHALGVPCSPKSDKILMPSTLFHLSNGLLAHYIAGLYDTDGSVSIRKTRGSNCIDFSTCSEMMVRQLQLVLLRYGIHATLRQRPPTTGKIKGKLNRWILEVRGGEQIKQFAQHIPLRHPKKKKKLDQLACQTVPANTNVDCIPTLAHRLRRMLINESMGLKRVGWRKNLSREAIQKIVVQAPNKNAEIDDIKKIAFSDIFWEKAVSIKTGTPAYSHVYDLTVKDSHNFVVDGILIHNTAAVVRDEFLKGWALEAGALVLANNGFVMIDELDKMSKEDRSAMHEALEQQCYSRDLEILFADGSKKPIGDFVDELMEKNQEKIKRGINCEILDAETDVKILTTDFNTISPTLIKSVSRHAAPETMVKITLANGRILQVTPEHPCWAVQDGKITTIPAQMMREGEYFPLPSELPIMGATQKFSDTPLKNGPALCSLLGYHITDGCYELNRGKKNGIQFWNNDKILIDDYCNAAEKVFGKKPSIVMRGKQFSARLVSKEVASSLRALDKNLMEKGKQKTIPDQIMQCKTEDVALLLRALFDGDGTAVNVPRNGCRVSLVTENRKLADQVTELLLRFGILSSIYNDRAFFKVDVTGHDNLLRFYQKIGFLSRKKQERLREYLKKKKTYRSVSDVVPHTSLKIRTIFRQLALSQEKEVGQIGVEHEKHRVMLQKMVKIAEEKKGILLMEREKAQQTIQAGVLGNIRRRANLSLLSMAKKNGISAYLLGQKEKKNEPFGTYQKTILGKIDSMLSCLPDVEELKKLAYGKVRWSKVKMIEIVKNTTGSLVYDVAIEPTHSFISNNMVLHNSVSISKANIQATLRCETTVLAAANPKFGRFDPYELIAKQIDLPPTLINRFDLIFPIKDLPDQKNDTKMASFILALHKEGIKEDVEINTDLLRKFIAYTRRNIHPQLSDEAIEEIRDYYVSMRNSGQDEGGIKAIPITARQLEALVRLAEASAKVRLSQTVSREDAKRSISLVDYCLRQVGLDKETGKIDIDRISSGITASQRNRIVMVKEIIGELEKTKGSKTIGVEDIIHEAEGRGIPREQVDDVIEKLKRAGDIFEPKKGFVTRI